MEIITKEEFMQKKQFFIDEIKKGKVFIYPTDTIYGLGCDARNADAVKMIRDIKRRDKNPFSVIAPSKKWITDNCIVDGNAKTWIAKLPGAYTLILRLKNKEAVCEEVNNSFDTIGIRIPDNWFTSAISELGRPFVTTSVNLAGEKFMTSLENMNKEVKEKVDYIVYTGELVGKPSTIVSLAEKEEKIVVR